MKQLEKLAKQFEKENPGEKALDPEYGDWNNEFVEWLASRPTCGVEQRKFLDLLENEMDSSGSIEDPNYDWELNANGEGKQPTYILSGWDCMEININKVIKGE